MKKFWLSFCIVFSAISSIAFAGNLVKKVYFSPYPIRIDGEEYCSEMPILQYQERTYVALREFAEMVDVDVEFSNNQIIIKTEVENEKVEESVVVNEENITSNSKMVYISKTGKKYHKLSNCNNAEYFEVSLAEAIAKGCTPCLRCAK